MHVLVIGPAWVGDMVMAQALVGVLQRCGARVHLLAPSGTAPLAERMPGVEAVSVLRAGHGDLALAERRRCARGLRALAFDQAIVLPNSFKSALVPWWAGIPLRTGWRGEMRFGLLNDLRAPATAPLRQVDRFVALAQPSGAGPCEAPTPQLRADPARAATLRQALGLRIDAPVLACCPGAAFGPSKQWPARHWAMLIADHLDHQEGEVWLLGARGDAALAAEIRAALPEALARRVQDLSGRTGLLDALDLLSLASRVLSNDSGLMHMAAALGMPVLGLFGSSSATHTPPLGPAAEALSLRLACSPCFQRRCPLGHGACLADLTPSRVRSRLDAMPVGLRHG